MTASSRAGSGFSYAGRKVAVTGCSSGIGQALAVVLRDRGATVIGLDRNPPATGAVNEFIEIDLADQRSTRHGAEVLTQHGVDRLFNVAGVTGALPPASVISINFLGMRELTEIVVAGMRPGGAVVTTASTAASRFASRRELLAGLLASDGRAEGLAWCDRNAARLGSGYALSKDAVVWYTIERAVRLAARGVRINCVAPGVTDTPILADTRAARGDAFLESIPLPLGRPALPQEQATVMAFAGSDDAAYLTGQVLWVDGGYMAGVAAGQIEDRTGAIAEATPPADQPLATNHHRSKG